MEVMIPKTMDFDFGSARSSPYLSAPSTPTRFGDLYFSAPTSPTRVSQFYRDFDDFSVIEGEYNKSQTGGSSSSSANIPFNWEEKPGTPRSSTTVIDDENDFAFCVSEELEKASRSAEELFDGGKIRPLKPPPRLQLTIDHHHHHHHHEESGAQKSPVLSPRSPISYGKKIIRDALSPRQKKETGPFSVENSSRKKTTERERGRERVSGLSSSSRRAGTRSLSPLRVSEFSWEEEQQRNNNNNNNKQCNSLTPKPPSSTKGCSRKWRLKDFLLFRSASEGRATDKDPFKKYAAATSFKHDQDLKFNINNGSFRSIDSSTASSKRRGPAVSAHELHYTMNRAVSEDLKKKTFLPYKQGILGRLAFNPAVHALANGFGSLTR